MGREQLFIKLWRRAIPKLVMGLASFVKARCRPFPMLSACESASGWRAFKASNSVVCDFYTIAVGGETLAREAENAASSRLLGIELSVGASRIANDF